MRPPAKGKFQPTVEAVEEDQCVQGARPAGGRKVMGSGYLAANDGASTPLMVGDNRNAPRYMQILGKDASRKCYIEN